MNYNQQFDESIKVTVISLQLSGIETKPVNRSKILNFIINHCLFYFGTIWLHTDILAEVFWILEGIQSGKGVIELSAIAPCILISVMSTAKVSFLYLRRAVLIEILIKLKSIHPNLENGDHNAFYNTRQKLKEREIVEGSKKLLKIVVNLLLVISIFVLAAFAGLPALTMLIEFKQTGKLQRQLPFLVKYFFDPFVASRWPFVYIHQVLATLVVNFNMIGSETLYFALCIYLTMHFQLLCHRFEHIVLSKHDDSFKQRIKEAVKRHQELIKLTKDVENLYSKSNLCNIIFSSVLICLSGFNIVFNRDIQAVLSYITFMVLNISQVFLLCYFGDMLMRSSSKVLEAVYKSHWYDADQESKKTLLIIMKRAQKPCKLTASNFADINLSAFTTILSRSWSYFAMLQTMYN